MADATRHRDRATAKLKLADPHEFPITLVPVSTLRSTVLPASRRRLFGEHLVAVLTHLTQSPAPSGAALPPDAQSQAVHLHRESPAVAAACATCRGHCCQDGGVKAYIDEATLLRFARANPSLDRNETVHAYTSHLPGRSMKDSCVFHGEHGCTLPRHLRSATCNTYHCDGVRKLQALDAAQVLITAATEVAVVRVTVFENAPIAGALLPRTGHT